MGVDANQGYSVDVLDALIPVLLENDIKLLEQPLPRGREAELNGFARPLPFAADESVQDASEIEALAGLFDVINIKLDKCGGLTEGLLMAQEARRLGLRVMVGNMGGSSLSMGPSFVLGQECDIVDLDGPIFLANDRRPGVEYADGKVWSGPAVWGGAGKTPA